MVPQGESRNERTRTDRPGVDLVMMDAVDLAAAIRDKRVSCREVMQAHLDQIDRFNPAVNAVVSLVGRDALMQQAAKRDEQLARGECMGWMHGFPHAVKNLAPTRGIRTTLGSPLFENEVPAEDALFVERLRRNGAILIGKTNVPEFGMGSHTYNSVFGTPGTPTIRRSRRAVAAAVRRSRSPSAWFRSPMAAISAAHSATRQPGTPCSGSALPGTGSHMAGAGCVRAATGDRRADGKDRRGYWRCCFP